MVSILCCQEDSNYRFIPGLDLWDKNRDAYNFSGTNTVITHAPCSQWSRLKSFANANKREKNLAYFCWEYVLKNGGIFEHPFGSSFFKHVGIYSSDLFYVDQVHFGFPARKRTALYFSNIPIPGQVSSNCSPTLKVSEMNYKLRSKQTLSFCNFLVSQVV